MNKLFTLKITLKNIAPPIWRRIEVDADTRLDDFHYLIQSTMGWENGHLHAFSDSIGQNYIDAESIEFGNDGFNECDFELSKIFEKVGEKMQYDYDFGDGWEHIILLEAISAPEPGVKYPRCTKGKRACPPEDCGGPWGYQEIVEEMAKKKGARYKELKEWLGGKFDAEEFDLVEINERLA
jgi:hypothetical protein